MVQAFTTCALLVGWLLTAPDARAEGSVPAATALPQMLSLDEALAIFRKQGLDLLIADATTRNAEGAVLAAGAIANPIIGTSIGLDPAWNASKSSTDDCNASGADCHRWAYTVSISDQAAIGDLLSGKHGLRLKVARNALAAAKMSRADAERTIALQVKTAYLQVAQGVLAYEFAKEVSALNGKTLKKFQARFDKGAINQGDLQRIETQQLESEQALDSATANLRGARISLAYLLGLRGAVPDFDVDRAVLDFAVPAPLRQATEGDLVRTALERRPDLLALGYQRASADWQLQLVRRQRFPDITLGLNYGFGGYGGWSVNGSVQVPLLTLSLSAPIPFFYQLQGEQRQAQAQLDTTSLQQAKAAAQVVNDVATGLANFVSTRKLVERMEGQRRSGGGLLESAKGAFEVTAFQYEKGAVGLTDYLDALRTYVAVKGEYFQDLTNYWTAVYQFEAALAKELR